jgi:putative nucleotidyltransferase with HDIG domain
MRKARLQSKVKGAEREKALSGLFFDKLIQYALEPVMVTDSDGRIVFANREYLEYFGLKLTETVGREWTEMIVPGAVKLDARKAFQAVKKRNMLSFFDTPHPSDKKKGKHLCWVAIPFRKGRTSFFIFVGGEKSRKGACRVAVKGADHMKMTDAHEDLVDMLVEAVWASEPETAKHSARVMHFAVRLARKLGIGEKRIARLKVASLLHDLGKLGIDEKILFKKGKLEKHEFDEIKKHPHWGADAVAHLYFLNDIIPIMADHHENFDGTGYPRGVKGEEIPIEARVLSVADVYEALTADRPYRKGFPKDEAIKILEDERGRKLDPEVTDMFLKMIKGKTPRWEKL